MFKLKRISLHNWYLVDALDIPVREHAALIGQTGAGKSSVLDAIQTVISGNNRNVLELNAAAGAQRGRSVRDYALGCVSDVNEGKPRRDRCETTLALTFFDADLDKHLVLGLLLKAEQDLAEQTKRFIIEDCDFRIEDFVRDGVVVSHEDMIERIRKDHGEKALSFHPNSTRFVNAYLETMRPSMPPDAKRFLRSFANALQAREMTDPTDFVRRFVLEPLPLDVEGVRSSITVWREMADEVQRIEGMSRDLSIVLSRYKEGFGNQLLESKLNAIKAAADLAEARISVQELHAELDSCTSSQRDISEQHRLKSEHLEMAKSKRDGLRLRLSEQDASAQIAGLQAERKVLEERKSNLRGQIEDRLRAYADLRHLKSVISDLSGVAEVCVEAASLQKMMTATTPEEWSSKEADLSASLKKIKEVLPEANVISAVVDERRQALFHLRSQMRDLMSEETAPEVLSRSVRQFMQDLEAAGIRSRCLPDLVTISDESWAFALEAILGPNREAVFVHEDDTRAAFEILYRNRNAYDAVRLVDLRRLKSMRPRIADNSIVEIVHAEDAEIQHFLEVNVGRYSRAETEEELSSSQSAIMRNGKTGSGATLRVFRDRRPILGKTAQKATQGVLAREAEEAREELEELHRQVQLLEAAHQRIRDARAIDPEVILKSLASLQGVLIELRGLEQRRASLDLPDTSGLEAEISALDSEISANVEEVKSLSDQSRNLDVRRGVIESRISDKEASLTVLEARGAELSAASESSLPDAIKHLVVIEDRDLPVSAAEISELDHLGPDAARGKISEYKATLATVHSEISKSGSSQQLIARGNNGLLSFAQRWVADGVPLSENNDDAQRFAWVAAEHDRLSNHELLLYRERLEQARAEMEESLTEGLIGRIGEQFLRMEEQLTSLNRRLAKYSFVGQTYQFRSSVSAKFLPIYRLVTTEVNGDQSVLDIADDESLAALDSLIAGEGDDVRAFEDYRNYFNFELYIEHPDPEDETRIVSTPFSQVMGKLSGGQRQAPYYVAIAASLVSAYYPKATAGDFEGMGLMVFDEAFNKLDIPNTQKLMELFRSLGLQVIVAAPEEKRSSLIECVDSVISVSRIPGSSDVFIDTVAIGARTKERMLAENPVHKSAEELARVTVPGE